MLKSQFGQLKCDQNLLASQINGHVWNMHVTDWIKIKWDINYKQAYYIQPTL